MFFTGYLVRQLREIASIVALTGIASEIVGESSDGVCALGSPGASRLERWPNHRPPPMQQKLLGEQCFPLEDVI
jgi:hypothetical protein